MITISDEPRQGRCLWIAKSAVVLQISAALIGVLFLSSNTASAAPAVVAPNKMRPYAGIGVVLLLPQAGEALETVSLYEEPSLARLGSIDIAKAPKQEWFSGMSPGSMLLVVSQRKGKWLRVVYDEAGREAWMVPPRPARFEPWDVFLKGKLIRLLPGLNKRYYQLFDAPGKKSVMNLSSAVEFKLLRVEGDWALVMPEKNYIGWVRWRDEDGRIIIGVNGSNNAS